jgi:membrane protein DedA with SNARE-associated domain
MTVAASITQTVSDGVSAHGVAGVFVLMALDALLPVGGELVMVVAGAIAAGTLAGTPTLFGWHIGLGAQSYLVLSLSGVAGTLVGAIAGWLIGARFGHDVLERHGRLVHLGPGRLHRAEAWFERHGAWAVLLGRLTPLVRSFISIPAGLFGEPPGRYMALTTIAAAIWCFGFAGLGWALGSHYGSVDHVTHVFEAAVIAALIAIVVILWRRRAIVAE